MGKDGGYEYEYFHYARCHGEEAHGGIVDHLTNHNLVDALVDYHGGIGEQQRE